MFFNCEYDMGLSFPHIILFSCRHSKQIERIAFAVCIGIDIVFLAAYKFSIPLVERWAEKDLLISELLYIIVPGISFLHLMYQFN